MFNERVRIWGGVFIASTVWGTTWLAIKFGLLGIPPILAVAFRFVIACAVLGGIVWWKRLAIGFGRNEVKVYLSMGFLTFILPFVFVYWGQQFIPSALGSILFAAFPFWVALFAHLMLDQEKLNRATIGGMIVSFLGIIIIFWDDLQISNADSLLGMGAITVAVIIQALSLVQVRKWGEGMSPVVQNFVGMAIGMLVLLPVGLLAEGGVPLEWTVPAVVSLLYLSLVVSVLTLVAYYWLLQRIDPVYLSLTSFVNPIVALLLGAIVLGESLRPSASAGAGLVMAGLLLANAKGIADKIRPGREKPGPA